MKTKTKWQDWLKSMSFFWVFHFIVIGLLVAVISTVIEFKKEQHINANLESKIVSNQQFIESYTNKNNYYNLESTKQKIIKDKGYKFIGETVINTEQIENKVNEEVKAKSTQNINNFELWQECFGLLDTKTVIKDQSDFICR